MRCALAKALIGAVVVAALAGAMQAGGTGSDRQSAGLHARAVPSRSVTAGETPGWHGGEFGTATGEHVTVYVSDTYSPEQVAPQAWADFFARSPHGRELATVIIRIAPLMR